MKRILLVEDCVTLASLVDDYLKSQDFIIEKAASGKEGVDKLRTFLPDFVILDISLPDINGLDIIDKVIDYSDLVPIIIISGSNDIRTAVDAVHKGAWDFIQKPFTDLSVLTKAIQRAGDKVRYIKKERDYLSRLERHSKAAKQMQECLFPEERMQFEDYIVESCIISSIGSSGDFIDYFSIDENRFGFYVADVAGHGVAAAFLTIILKSFVNLYKRQFVEMNDETILNPGRMLTLLNRELLKERFGRQISLFYGVIDRRDRQMYFTNSGIYPHPILFEENKKSFIQENSLPIGVIEKDSYKTVQIILPESFGLLLFTDGILEVLPEDSSEGHRNRVMNMVEGFKTGKESIEEKISQIIKERESEKIPDDISFLLIRRIAQA